MWNPPTGGVPVHDVRLTAASTEGFMLDRPLNQYVNKSRRNIVSLKYRMLRREGARKEKAHMTDGEAAENASTGGVASAAWCGGSCEGTMQTRLVAWPAIEFCPSPHRRR